MNNGLRAATAISIAAFVLLVPAILNGFPFVFLPDTTEYLAGVPLIYRSPFYMFFIAVLAHARWVWLLVAAQALIVSHLLWLMLSTHGVKRNLTGTIALAVFLALFSSLPFFVGFIMSDIFTAVMVIALYLLAFHNREMSWGLRLYLMLLAVFAVGSHAANPGIAVLLIILSVPLLFWLGMTRRDIVRRLGIILLPVLSAMGLLFLYNIYAFGTYSLAPTGSVFLMANLIEHGPAKAYIREACPEAGYKICVYQGHFPPVAEQFLWTEHMLENLGGFLAMRDEASAINRATFERYPAEVMRVIAEVFVGGLVTHDPAAEFQVEPDAGSLIVPLHYGFGPGSVDAFLNSAQMRGAIPHAVIAEADAVLVPVMFVLLVVGGIFAVRNGMRREAALACFIIVALAANTFFCATISGVHARYQARMTWLIPLAVFVISAAFLQSRKAAKITEP